MLTNEEKRFFASIAVGAGGLSGCGKGEGAVLIRGQRILSYGYNRKIIKDKEWEMSATADALFGVRDLNIQKASIFLTKFPNLEDLKMIVAVGVETIYFLGSVNNGDSVKLINSLSENSIPLEIIKLE